MHTWGFFRLCLSRLHRLGTCAGQACRLQVSSPLGLLPHTVCPREERSVYLRTRVCRREAWAEQAMARRPGPCAHTHPRRRFWSRVPGAAVKPRSPGQEPRQRPPRSHPREALPSRSLQLRFCCLPFLFGESRPHRLLLPFLLHHSPPPALSLGRPLGPGGCFLSSGVDRAGREAGPARTASVAAWDRSAKPSPPGWPSCGQMSHRR